MGGWAPVLGAGAGRGSPRPPFEARHAARRVLNLAFAHDAPCCPRHRRGAAPYDGGGGGGWRSRALWAAVRCRWLAVLQCCARPRAPCHRRAPTRPFSRRWACGLFGLWDRRPGRGVAQGSGARACRWGAPGPPVRSPPPPRHLGSEAPDGRSCRALAHQRRGWLSLAPPFARRLGLRRWLVPWAVALVPEGGTQGLGHPDIGLRVRDA